jgi:hypothetical protein
MTRILAVDWDVSDVRCVLASVTGKDVKVLWATSVPLEYLTQEDLPPSPDVSSALRTALADQRIGRLPTVIGLDRASVEMFNFTLPPATDAELALLVQNQILRESPSLAEEDAVDYVPSSVEATEPRPVTVAVLTAERRQAILQICKAAGLKPARLVLRPLAAASYFVRTNAPPELCCLLVNVLAEEADLTVLWQGRAAILRTVRLPRGVPAAVVVQRLMAEINRTLVLAQQGPCGRPPERIYLFGGPGEYQALVDQIEADLPAPLTVLDPLVGLDTAGLEVPEHAGRFAALLGMAQDQADGAHALDFLHPKRPPRPANRRRALLAAAAAVGLLGAVGGYLYWDTLAALQAANRQLSQQRKELDETVKISRPRTQFYEAVGDWKDAEIVWLDELRELSLQLPPSRDLLVHRLTLSAGRSGGGVIELQGVARTAAVIARIDRELRNPYHAVSSRRVGDYPQGRDYSWLFERTITVVPRDKADYRGDDTDK